MSVAISFLALIAELAFGYPQWLYARIGHPVTWIGRLIGYLDNRFNRSDANPARRYRNGLLCLAVIILLAGGSALVLDWFFSMLPYGWIAVSILATSLLAQRSLAAHVGAVVAGLDSNGLEGGRDAVSKIVGRDTAMLDESSVSRAAVESLAENFSDGVVAPAFWLAVGGLPAIAVYKAVNTADSMIGHRSERHLDFGRAAALLDDLVNWPAARLSAGLVIAAAAFVPGASPSAALAAVRRDARRHRSPNAGWPEAAFAGALGIEIAGPRSYGGRKVDDAIMGAGGRSVAGRSDIRRALHLYWAADLLFVAVVGIIAALICWLG